MKREEIGNAIASLMSEEEEDGGMRKRAKELSVAAKSAIKVYLSI